MAKAITLTLGGKVFGRSRGGGVDVVLDQFDVALSPLGFEVRAQRVPIFGLLAAGAVGLLFGFAFWPLGVAAGIGLAVHFIRKERLAFRIGYADSRTHVLDVGRSAGKAAAGGVVGALVAGPLGLLAGAALGGRKAHTVVVDGRAARLVLELSTSEMQTLAARMPMG